MTHNSKSYPENIFKKAEIFQGLSFEIWISFPKYSEEQSFYFISQKVNGQYSGLLVSKRSYQPYVIITFLVYSENSKILFLNYFVVTK